MATTIADPTEFGFKTSLVEALAANWYLILLRGVVAVAFGLIAIILPNMALKTVIYLIGAFALVDGVFAVAAGFRGGASPPRWWLFVVGLAGIGAGLAAVFVPEMTAFLLIMFVGVWAIVKGLFEIVGAVAVRKEIDNEWMLIFGGALSVLFGLIVVIAPGAGALALLWAIGIYAVLSGAMLIAFALRLRNVRNLA